MVLQRYWMLRLALKYANSLVIQLRSMRLPSRPMVSLSLPQVPIEQYGCGTQPLVGNYRSSWDTPIISGVWPLRRTANMSLQARTMELVGNAILSLDKNYSGIRIQKRLVLWQSHPMANSWSLAIAKERLGCGGSTLLLNYRY